MNGDNLLSEQRKRAAVIQPGELIASTPDGSYSRVTERIIGDGSGIYHIGDTVTLNTEDGGSLKLTTEDTVLGLFTDYEARRAPSEFWAAFIGETAYDGSQVGGEGTASLSFELPSGAAAVRWLIDNMQCDGPGSHHRALTAAITVAEEGHSIRAEVRDYATVYYHMSADAARRFSRVLDDDPDAEMSYASRGAEIQLPSLAFCELSYEGSYVRVWSD